jgi:alpha-L-rhamnosidase
VVPNVVPDGGGTGWSDGFGATGWADAAVVIPWVVYRNYGDTSILQNQYESMKGWTEYMIHQAGNRYIFDYGFHFGDWLSFAEYYSYNYNAPDYGYAGAHTDKALIATAYFYYTTGLMQQIATILGRKEDAMRYENIRPFIKSAFSDEFVTKTGRLTSGTQTAYAMALAFGIMPDNMRDIAAKRLADDVAYFGHLTSGFLGTPLLCHALADNSYPDLAFQLLFNKRYPSWLYPVTKGATTIWERWDCIKPDGSFQTAGMNSFNHYAYGAVGQFLYSRVAGIDQPESSSGYKQFVIRPVIPQQLTWARASYQGVYGLIESGWEVVNGTLKIQVTIPSNTSTVIYLPSADVGRCRMNGKPLSEWLKSIDMMSHTDEITIKTGSGHYNFEVINFR